MFKNKNNKVNVDELNSVIGLSKKILKVLFIVLIGGLIFLGVYLLRTLKVMELIGGIIRVSAPFFIGLVIAWLLDPLVNFLVKKNVKRSIAAIAVFIVFLLVLYLLFRLMIPQVYKQINDFVSIIPNLLKSVQSFINDVFSKLGNSGFDLTKIKANIFTSIDEVSLSITNNLPSTAYNVITSIITSLGTFIIGLVVGFYLLIDFNGIKHLLDFVPKKFHKGINTIVGKLNEMLKSFVNGTLTISVIITILSWIAFSLLKIPSPLLFALLCGFTNIIPYFGPWIGGAFVTIVGFTISPLTGVITLVVVFVIQQIDQIILNPLILSKQMKLHPVTVVVGLLIFGYLFGILGMVLAVPVMSMIKILLNYFDEKYDLLSKLKKDDLDEERLLKEDKDV